MSASPDPNNKRNAGGFSRIQVTQDIVAGVMTAAILASAGGVLWLVTSLPNRLNQIEQQMTQILKNQDAFGERFMDLEKTVNEFDRRIIKLELRK